MECQRFDLESWGGRDVEQRLNESRVPLHLSSTSTSSSILQDLYVRVYPWERGPQRSRFGLGKRRSPPRYLTYKHREVSRIQL